MSETNRSGCFGSRTQGNSCGNNSQNGISCGNSTSGSVLIDTYQVFDSCRDRDCFEDVRVYLDEMGQSLIEHTGQVRCKSAEICSSSISVEPVQLSRGFYRITVRFYVKLELEACVCPGKPQTFCGLAVTEKSVVLYGGDGEVRVFRSTAASDSFCSTPCTGEMSTNLPVAVVETVDPGNPRRAASSNPRSASAIVAAAATRSPNRFAVCSAATSSTAVRNISRLSLGFFSVIRLERPEQYLINRGRVQRARQGVRSDRYRQPVRRVQSHGVPDRRIFTRSSRSVNRHRHRLHLVERQLDFRKLRQGDDRLPLQRPQLNINGDIRHLEVYSLIKNHRRGNLTVIIFIVVLVYYASVPSIEMS